MAMLAHSLVLVRPGAVAGLILAAVLLPAYAVLCFRTGLGTIVDLGGGLLLGALVLLAATSVILLGLAIVRGIPLRLGALIGTTIVCLIVAGKVLGVSAILSIGLGAPPVLLLVLAGAGLSLLLRGRGRLGAPSTLVAALALLVVVLGAAVLIYWLAAPGTDPFVKTTKPALGGPVVPLDAPNPSQVGPYPVAALFYGSGTDRRREYGPAVDLKTDSVDASLFIAPSTKRLELWARKDYWGFEPNSFPLNARVWFPKNGGPFPLVLIVHGNHRMEQPSEAGYAYLGELLASRGFIVASVDQNFLNDSWFDDFGEERGVRSWLLLKHLEQWRTWNGQQGNPFFQKVDLANIALIGQSRGGEAILHAARFNRLTRHPDNANVTFNFGFDIRTLIAIAPTDGRYRPHSPTPPIEDVDYLLLQGSHDADLGEFAGARRYRRVSFTGQEYRMKAVLYVYRANHSQFNTVWGQYDEGPPLGYLLNRESLLSGDQQRTVAKVYISAFLEATLHDRREYVPLFRDHHRAAHWLPNTVYLSRFEDCDFRTIADFDDPIEATETKIPGGSQQGEGLGIWERREMMTRLGQGLGDHGVVLGWNTAHRPGGAPARIPRYGITLPEIPALSKWRQERLALSFCLADTARRCPPAPEDHSARRSASGSGSTADADAVNPNDGEAPIDMTLEFVASNGSTARLPLSHYYPLQRALKVTFSKWPLWERARYRSPIEPVLQTYEIPLADFAKANPQFDPALLKQICFVFDRTKSAVIILDEVGFTRIRGTTNGNP